MAEEFHDLWTSDTRHYCRRCGTQISTMQGFRFGMLCSSCYQVVEVERVARALRRREDTRRRS